MWGGGEGATHLQHIIYSTRLSATRTGVLFVFFITVLGLLHCTRVVPSGMQPSSYIADTSCALLRCCYFFYVRWTTHCLSGQQTLSRLVAACVSANRRRECPSLFTYAMQQPTRHNGTLYVVTRQQLFLTNWQMLQSLVTQLLAGDLRSCTRESEHLFIRSL